MNETSKARPAQKCFRMSERGKELLAELAERFGVNETAVVELAIREKAERAGIPAFDGERSGAADSSRVGMAVA